MSEGIPILVRSSIRLLNQILCPSLGQNNFEPVQIVLDWFKTFWKWVKEQNSVLNETIVQLEKELNNAQQQHDEEQKNVDNNIQSASFLIFYTTNPTSLITFFKRLVND